MTILELIWGRFCNEYAAWCGINLFRSLRRHVYHYWMKNDQLWSNLTPRVWPHSIQPLHRVPDLPQWSNSQIWWQVGVDVGLEIKAWSRSTDTIQSPVGLIHIHIMHNWGPRRKVIVSEAWDMTKSMVMWLILTRNHDHSEADLG